MSQHELGRQLGISFQQVQKYEGGTNRISASVLFRVAQLFGVPLSYFYEGAGYLLAEFAPIVPADRDDDRLRAFARTAEGCELLAAYLQVEDPAVRKRVLALIRSMAATMTDEATETV